MTTAETARIAGNDITLAIAECDVPEDIDRQLLSRVAFAIRDLSLDALAHNWGDAGYITMHADSTGHVGLGDAASCESWPEDRSGVTLEISEAAIEGRAGHFDAGAWVAESPSAHIAEAALDALDEIADLTADDSQDPIVCPRCEGDTSADHNGAGEDCAS